MNVNDTILRMWTVYDHPTDYPDHFVARLFEVHSDGTSNPTASIIISENLETIRVMMEFEMHLTCITRRIEDDAKIVEVWL